MMIPSRITRTKKAKKRAMALKTKSWSWPLSCFGSGISATLTCARKRGASIIVGMVPAVAAMVCRVQVRRGLDRRIRQLVSIRRIGPVEELQDFLGRVGLRLRLVHENERCAGDRPRILARLVGQHQVVARRLAPVRASGRRLEGLRRGTYETSLAVLYLRVGHLVLQRIGVLNIAE